MNKKKLTGKKQQAIRRLMRNGTENTQKGEWLEKQRQPQMQKSLAESVQGKQHCVRHRWTNAGL